MLNIVILCLEARKDMNVQRQITITG